MNRNLPPTVEPVSDMTGSLRSGVVLVRLIEQLSGEQVDKRIPNATYTLQMLENLLTAFKFMDRVGVSTDGYTVKDIFNGNEDKIVLMFESIRARFPNDSATPAAPSSASISAPAAAPSPVAALNNITSGPIRSMGITSSPLLGGAIPSGQPTGSLPAPPSGQPPKGSPRPPPPPNSNGSVGRSPKIGNGASTSQPASSSSMAYQQQQQQQQQQPAPSRMQAQNTGGSEFEALYDEAARSTIS